MGRDICDVHWEKIAGSDGKTEKSLLKKIGLERDESCCVVPISGVVSDE